MDNQEDKYLNLEKKYQESLNSQKRYYESEISLIKSKNEYEIEKIKIEYENKIFEELKKQENYNNVKNVEDLENQKKYYLSELESQRNWYEEEIKRRCKEVENWHINNLQKETKKYEEMLQAQQDKHKALQEALSIHIQEQQEYYENELKPFKRLIKIRKKILRILSKFEKKQNKEITINEIQTGDNENKVKVSVILPVYNVGKYLRQSLDSLINQTLKDIEIICVNDGSTDDCYEILEEYKQKDSRIKVIHKENKGTGAARNDGLRIASGECIGFVDPDDWVKPDMYEKLYSLIKEKNLEIAMCMPDGYDEKNNKTAPFPYFVDSNFDNIPSGRIFNLWDISPFQYPMCVWNKLYTKELFDKNHIEFAEGLDFEDHKVIFGALLTARRMYFIKDKLYVYRYNREGSVLTDNNQRLIDHIEIFNIVENILKETNTYNEFRNDFLVYKIHNLLYYYGMIKDEYKQEYYQNMVKSIKETNLNEEELKMLTNKYPELNSYI